MLLAAIKSLGSVLRAEVSGLLVEPIYITAIPATSALGRQFLHRSLVWAVPMPTLQADWPSMSFPRAIRSVASEWPIHQAVITEWVYGRYQLTSRRHRRTWQCLSKTAATSASGRRIQQQNLW